MQVNSKLLAGIVFGLNTYPALLFFSGTLGVLAGGESVLQKMLAVIFGFGPGALFLYLSWKLVCEPRRYAALVSLLGLAGIVGSSIPVYQSIANGGNLAGVVNELTRVLNALLVVLVCLRIWLIPDSSQNPE